jgi:hypothetical protein
LRAATAGSANGLGVVYFMQQPFIKIKFRNKPLRTRPDRNQSRRPPVASRGLATAGSIRPITSKVSHAGIVTTTVALRMPTIPPD